MKLIEGDTANTLGIRKVDGPEVDIDALMARIRERAQARRSLPPAETPSASEASRDEMPGTSTQADFNAGMVGALSSVGERLQAIEARAAALEQWLGDETEHQARRSQELEMQVTRFTETFVRLETEVVAMVLLL